MQIAHTVYQFWKLAKEPINDRLMYELVGPRTLAEAKSILKERIGKLPRGLHKADIHRARYHDIEDIMRTERYDHYQYMRDHYGGMFDKYLHESDYYFMFIEIYHYPWYKRMWYSFKYMWSS
ncbi:MAG: hypothetical protein WC455_16645 [Dehalococcoidia bacterium]|jgi:hypothetical protein